MHVSVSLYVCVSLYVHVSVSLYVCVSVFHGIHVPDHLYAFIICSIYI